MASGYSIEREAFILSAFEKFKIAPYVLRVACQTQNKQEKERALSG